MQKNEVKILVTGHCGFIGRHLCRRLETDGYSFVGYDLVMGQDIRNYYQLEDVFEKEQINCVIHLAAVTGVRKGDKHPQVYVDTNVLGTTYITKLCEEYSINNLIYTSSSSVFGKVKRLPTTEKSEKNPISLYGITKLAGEHIVNASTCKTTIVRPFTVYGENGRKDEVIFRWLEQIRQNKPITIYGFENSMRGYVYVGDLVNVFCKLLEIPWTWEHEDFNIGGCESIQLKELFKIFQENFPDLKYRNYDANRFDIHRQYANLEKAKRVLEYNPEPKFRERVTEIIKLFKTDNFQAGK